jgi:hypothetical protein
MRERPPIRTIEELASAPPELIVEHMSWELQRLLADTGSTHLDFAQDLGYQASGNVSRWIHGREPISREGAARLDERYPGFELYLTGERFATLHARMRRARARVPPGKSHFDVFLASPMESVRDERSDGHYPAERGFAREMVAALMNHCGFSKVFYAGHAIESPADWESPDSSLEGNVDAMRNSDYFVLLALTPPPRPSGIYVEAGLALALGKPSVYFVTSDESLPWMLRNANGHQSPHLPRVSIQRVESIEQALGRVRAERGRMFKRLD